MIKHIAFIAYPSNDVAATRAWYEDKLGLQFAGPYCEDGVEKYNEAHLGDGCFSLMASEWVGRAPGSAAGVFFEVDDIDGAMRALEEKGVTIDDVFDGPVCKSASFVDRDGNKVSIHEKKR